MNWGGISRNLGLLFIAASGFIVATGLAQSADWIDDPAPAPSGSPAPSPSASPAGSMYATRGGPIAIGITGQLVGGENLSSGLTGTEGGSVSNAGAVLSISRHTPDTSASLTVPAAIGAHSSSLGQASAEYDTAHQSYQYGPQQVGAIGLIPAGTTARGPAVLIPRKHGDLTLYTGAVGGQPSFIVGGARLRTVGKHGVSTLAVYDASAKGGGRVSGLLFGIITPPKRIAVQLELGAEHVSDLGLDSQGNPIPSGNAIAAEGRVDDGNQTQYTSFTFRDLSPNYEGLGGFSQADRFAGLTYRSTLGKSSPYTLTVEDERIGDVGSVDDTKTESLTLNERLGKSGTAVFDFTNQTGDVTGTQDWSGNASFGISLPLKAFSFSFTGGVDRTTNTGSAPDAGTNFQLALGRSFGTLTFQTTLALARTYSSSSGNDNAPTLSVGVARTFGKTSLALTTQFGRTFTDDSALEFVAPTLSISRRLSNVFVVTTNAALQFRKDPLQPTVDGRTVQFSFSLGAPFAIGNGVTSGRPNPHLPGTISGVVQQDQTAGFAGVSIPGSQIGASNIAVVLDGQRVVRTDVQGRFTFNFLQPGVHSISIDPASLPRGTQPASPITTVNVQGGQIQQIVLGIGSYGSIVGVVQAGDAAGTPIAGVAVLLDDKTRTVTDAHGQFAYGGLQAGTHTVTIVPETFPANFGLSGDNKQKITVATGESSRVSFTGAPLGSIAGTVTYDTGQDQAGKGVSNVYVVANPGDHAAITDDDGTYLIDNLPPGDYTLSIDPETLAEGLAVTSDASLEAHLGGGAHVSGEEFRIGEGEKGVVFTYNGSETNVVTGQAVTKRLPPGASTNVIVKTSQPVTKVTASIAGVTSALAFHANDKRWVGYVRIPANAPGGPASITIDATGKSAGSADIPIFIDPAIPIVTVKLNPAQPQRGQYVHVTAHFLVDAKAGDKIIWQDGTFVLLPKPRTGRYFEFDVKVTSIPFRGALITTSGQLPITLVH